MVDNPDFPLRLLSTSTGSYRPICLILCLTLAPCIAEFEDARRRSSEMTQRLAQGMHSRAFKGATARFEGVTTLFECDLARYVRRARRG